MSGCDKKYYAILLEKWKMPIRGIRCNQVELELNFDMENPQRKECPTKCLSLQCFCNIVVIKLTTSNCISNNWNLVQKPKVIRDERVSPLHWLNCTSWIWESSLFKGEKLSLICLYHFIFLNLAFTSHAYDSAVALFMSWQKENLFWRVDLND